MTVDAEPVTPTVLTAPAQVLAAERLSPAFVRVTLESPAFVDLGIEGSKPGSRWSSPVPPGELPRIGKSSEEWYAAWQSASASTGSPMRTYTVRDVLAHGNSRLLVVDMVVHEHGPQGPACRWALRARPGDELQVIAPHRRGLP